jgi:hypothetical protein
MRHAAINSLCQKPLILCPCSVKIAKNMSYRSYFTLRQANGYPFHAKSERLCQSSIKISYLFTILMLFNVATNFPIAKKKIL